MEWRRTQTLDEEGRALVERLGGRWTPNGGMCRCPAHDDRTPSLSVRPGRRRLLLHCFAGCRPADVLRALRAQNILRARSGVTAATSANICQQPLNDAALRIWREARPIAETPAAAYLAIRGLVPHSEELRFHPRTPHGRKPLTENLPALIAAVRDDLGILAIHRTFIAPDGRGLAAIGRPRCGLGRFGSGAVRLGGIARQLGLAEGIETALSASALFGVPCWATLGAQRFGRVRLPAEVEELLLFLDNDPGGRRAERLARDAFPHIRCIETFYPRGAGEDWNDVLRGCHDMEVLRSRLGE